MIGACGTDWINSPTIVSLPVADTHLKKLDSIHEKAQRIGNFTLGPLKSRREAAAISFTLKLLDGKGRGVLDAYAPVFIDNTKLHNYSTQNAPKGLQIQDRSRHKSRIPFDRSYLGCIHKIRKKLPNELVQKGAKDGWLKIKKSCTISITKDLKIKKGIKKAIKTPIKTDSPLVDFSRFRLFLRK